MRITFEMMKPLKDEGEAKRKMGKKDYPNIPDSEYLDNQ